MSPARLQSLERTIDALQELLAAGSQSKALAATTATATLTGTATDASTGLPITSGITVIAYDFSSGTAAGSGAVGAGGVYSFTVTAPGTYTLQTNHATNFISGCKLYRLSI